MGFRSPTTGSGGYTSHCPAATMVQCVGSVGTWTKTPKMTKSSLMAQWHPQYLPGVAAGKFQGGTLFVGMNVKGPVPHAQRTEWRSMRVLASVDLWLLVQGVLSPAAMPMCLLKASSRAVCWTSAWVGAAKTYCARHWLPMLLPVKLLASKSRTGGLRPVVVSGGEQDKAWARDTGSAGLGWLHSHPLQSFSWFLFMPVSWLCLSVSAAHLSLSALHAISSTLSLRPSLTMSLDLQVSLSPSVSVDVSPHSVPIGQFNIVLGFSLLHLQRSPALTTATMSSVAHPAQPAAHPLHDTQPQLHVMGPVWRDASVTRASS